MNRSPLFPKVYTSEQRIEEAALFGWLKSLPVLQLYDEFVDFGIVRLGILQIDCPLAG